MWLLQVVLAATIAGWALANLVAWAVERGTRR